MRVDARLPPDLLVDLVWQEWHLGFYGAWAIQRAPRRWPCFCSLWKGRVPMRSLDHWQYHGLLTPLTILRRELERDVAYQLAMVGGDEHLRVTDSVLPELRDEQESHLRSQLAAFDECVDKRLDDLPRQVARLSADCRVMAPEPRTGPESISDVLDRFMRKVEAERLSLERPRDDNHDSHTEEHVRARAAAVVRRFYARLALPQPHVLWATSPHHAEELAAALADACSAVVSKTAGFAEVEIKLALGHHPHLDEEQLREIRRVALRLAEPGCAPDLLVPTRSRVEQIEAQLLSELASRRGVAADSLFLEFEDGAAGLQRDVAGASRHAQQLAWTCRALENEPGSGSVRAVPSDAGLTPGFGDLLAGASETEVPGVAELRELRELVYSWSGNGAAVILVDQPVEWRSDRSGELHCKEGPAVRWSDGWALYFWHGRLVPGDLVERGWGVRRILAEPNVEVRRCAIERLGWDAFVRDANLRQVGGPVADPANPGHSLELYELPDTLLGRTGVNLLLCTNASEERDGKRKRLGLMVPASITDPLEAAARTFGLDSAEYARLEAAT